jgi:hypothetical protein
MKMYSSAIALAALLAAGSVSANEVIATVVADAKSTKGATPIAIDISSTGGAAGFSFRIEVPGVDESSAKLQNCLSELPKGFTGGCNVTKGAIYVIASSDHPSVTLPAGLVSVGTVLVNRGPVAKGNDASIRIVDVEFSDNNGNSVAGSAKVANN